VTHLQRTALDHKVIGYPVHLEGVKYPRNGLIWNLCFVFDAHQTNQVLSAYEPVVLKLAVSLKALEVLF
jgi:hypothetical protein